MLSWDSRLGPCALSLGLGHVVRCVYLIYPRHRQREFCASVAAAPKEKPVLVLSLQGKFNINVFTSRRSCTKEPGQKELTASLDSMRPSRWASTSRRSTSKNDYRKSVLTVE